MAEKSMQAPWRSEFILGQKEKGCVFCALVKEKKLSFKNLILYRAEKTYIVMNKFPYNGGHLLIVPNRHIGVLERLSQRESMELMSLTQLAIKILKKQLRPNAFNVGMNLGQAAGAGIPKHLHMHIVPRWVGDSNFMPIVGKTRVHSIPMDYIYKRLLEGFDDA
ncbi:MAG: HIT domain-containing protein [candidate division Zixibacteria bacterium]|nr:HIT domain-containing protein [candidate division Zixibacteria bacterium]